MVATQPVKPDYTRRAIGFGLACLLLGPPIGAVLIMLGFPLIELIQTRGASLDGFGLTSAGQYVAAIFIAALVSYVFGGFPALASAVWVGVRTFWSGRFGYGEAFVVGLVSTLLLAPVSLKMPSTIDPMLWTIGDMVLPASLASALIVRRILGRWMCSSGDLGAMQSRSVS